MEQLHVFILLLRYFITRLGREAVVGRSWLTKQLLKYLTDPA
jgi:hypothetical protein